MCVGEGRRTAIGRAQNHGMTSSATMDGSGPPARTSASTPYGPGRAQSNRQPRSPNSRDTCAVVCCGSRTAGDGEEGDRGKLDHPERRRRLLHLDGSGPPKGFGKCNTNRGWTIIIQNNAAAATEGGRAFEAHRRARIVHTARAQAVAVSGGSAATARGVAALGAAVRLERGVPTGGHGGLRPAVKEWCALVHGRRAPAAC